MAPAPGTWTRRSVVSSVANSWFGGVGLGAGQPVEQRGFSGVGVADERHGAHGGPAPRPALGRALALDVGEPLLQHLDPLAQQAAIGFELRFAGAAQADAAFLPLEVGPAADEPRELMLDLRELDLELAFRAARAQREDVENQARPVDDAAFEPLLEVALLRAGERVVEDDEIGGGFGAPGGDLLDLALAGIGRRVRALPPAGHRADHGRAGRHGQRVELGHPLGRVGVAEIERDEQRPVAALRAFKHAGSVNAGRR